MRGGEKGGTEREEAIPSQRGKRTEEGDVGRQHLDSGWLIAGGAGLLRSTPPLSPPPITTREEAERVLAARRAELSAKGKEVAEAKAAHAAAQVGAWVGLELPCF